MSSTYAQSGMKRQKVRDPRSFDVDYFQNIEKVEYSNMSSVTDTAKYRYYNASERINNKTMEDWLKFSVSLTEFRRNGADQYGNPTFIRPWNDKTDSLDNYKRCIKACFDFCVKLGLKYWTAFDSDLVPYTENFEENKNNWQETCDFIAENVQRTHVKPMWIAPDLHSCSRYASGAMTSPDALNFVKAATQIKKCLEVSQRLNCECFLIWPHRERFDAIFKTDVEREMKLFAKMLKLTSEYKDQLNYRCQLLIMPYYPDYGFNYKTFREDYEYDRRYMWDITSCLFFLKQNNLDRSFKVCCPPCHQTSMAHVYNMLGGVFLVQNNKQLNSQALCIMMKNMLDQNTCPIGGINLKLTPHRDSTDLRDLIVTYAKYIDAAAKGLRVAANIITEQIFSKQIQQKYSSYQSGYGSRLLGSDISMDELEECYKKNQHQQSEVTTSSKSEHLDIIFQRYLDNCE